jgi:hypothetical protein
LLNKDLHYEKERIYSSIDGNGGDKEYATISR